MKLFVGDNCPACDRVKEYVKQNNIEIEFVHESTRAGRDFAMEYRIMGKPCLLKLGRIYFGQDIYKYLK